MLYELKYTDEFTNGIKVMRKTRKAWKKFYTKIAKKRGQFTACNSNWVEERLTISGFINMLINTGDLVPVGVK